MRPPNGEVKLHRRSAAVAHHHHTKGPSRQSELPLESWRVSLCGRLAWCHPRVMGWRLQRRFSLNLSSLCVTDLTAVAIHNAATTAVAVLSGDACSGKPPFTGHFCGTGICESPGQA
jgi:hypothetical protein